MTSPGNPGRLPPKLGRFPPFPAISPGRGLGRLDPPKLGRSPPRGGRLIPPKFGRSPPMEGRLFPPPKFGRSPVGRSNPGAGRLVPIPGRLAKPLSPGSGRGRFAEGMLGSWRFGRLPGFVPPRFPGAGRLVGIPAPPPGLNPGGNLLFPPIPSEGRSVPKLGRCCIPGLGRVWGAGRDVPMFIGRCI